MTDDRAKQIAQLNSEITALRTAIASLATLPDARRPLEEKLAAKERELAALQGGAPPATRSHSQHIGGSAKVGAAIAGDVYGPVTSTNQSGGVNFGSGNQIGSIGDVVAGDKRVTEGPRVYGPITSGRDTNIATNQMINNTEPAGPSVTPATPPVVGPALRLWLEDSAGNALTALSVGEEALLRLGVDGEPTALPALDLTLEADGEGVAWPDDTRRRLALRPGESSRVPRWPLIPARAGLLTLRVLALAGGTLVQQLALTVASHTESSDTGVLSAPDVAPAPPALSVPVGFALSSAPALPTHANALNLVLDQEREGYRLLLLDGGSASACQLALTPAGLADLLAYAHTELLAIVGLLHAGKLVFQQVDLAIPQPFAEQSLARLARLGAYLWQALFAGTGGGRDAEALGERLRARSQAGALHLTITAAHLPFPWPLLYDRDLSAQITPDGFWGFRHILATVPTSGRIGPKAGDLALGPAATLRALVGLNLRIDQQPQLAAHPVILSQRRLFGELGLASDEVTDESALRERLAGGSDAGLVYLFCHMLSTLPGTQPARGSATAPGVGSSRIVLTEAKQALTLRDLQQAAPLSQAPLLHGGPLVVLNACGSADLSPLTYDGMAPYLLDLGARAVIGTECDTPICFGAAFGVALLHAFVRDRLSAGEALRAARRQFLEQQHNPLGLLYALYGSADLRVDESNAA